MNKNTLDFILNHPAVDTAALLLKASAYPDIDIPTAVRCIEARKKLKTKVPLWMSFPELLFPYPLALEQCSSQATAIYKQRFIPEGTTVADLTAGLGVDAFFMSQKAVSLDCFEHNPLLFQATKHNMALLGAGNISVTQGDSNILLNTVEKKYGLIYLDPDRRSSSGTRLYSIRDCEPDITLIKAGLFRLTDRILVKVSPMADISALLRMLPETSQVHVISVADQCREILLLMEKGFSAESQITAGDISITEGGIRTRGMHSTLSAEKEARCGWASSEDILKAEGQYLYQPLHSITKAGFLKLPAVSRNLSKISSNVHLYLSAEKVPDFPGKTFRIEKILPFGGKAIKSLKSLCPAASVTARDLPMTSDQLRIRSGISEDDTRHIFAFPASDGKKFIVITHS
ncbi:MAG: hypothetical protein KBS57_04990 [Alistipes sp.]|nr:hypothetical protein [Candidatus Minthomonas equi]